MRNTIIADTGYWLALANARDAFHQQALRKSEEFPAPLITTWPVIAETCSLLVRELGNPAQMSFLQNVMEGIDGFSEDT